MTDSCPTVMIETKNGPVIINETDFDKSSMKLSKNQALPEPEINEPSGAAPATTMLVAQDGKTKKFNVVDAEGNAVAVEGIEADGYDSEADAWAAIMAVNTAAA